MSRLVLDATTLSGARLSVRPAMVVIEDESVRMETVCAPLKVRLLTVNLFSRLSVDQRSRA
jgi:hypothetical protein